MSVEKLHDLEQKRDNIARQMRSLNETIGDKEWTDEQRTEFRNAQRELKDLDDKISLAREMRRLDEEEAKAQRSKEEHERKIHDATGGDEKRYADAFEKSMRFGLGELTREERQILKEVRALGEGTDTAGGYTVPTEFQSRIIETMKAYGGIANYCNVLNTSDGRQMEWATTDGTAEMGAFIGENTAAGEADPVFGQAILGAKKITSKIIKVSNELLQDTGVSLDSILANRIAMRIGRKEADAIVNGTGSGLENKGLAKQVTGTTAIATASKVTWRDVNALIHSVDPAYRKMNSFALAFNDNTLKLLEEQEDGQGRPLWLPAVAGVTPAKILGKPYFIDQAIPDAASTNKFMFAGDWNAFILRRVRYMQLRRLNELYAESDQVGFLAFHRFDTLLEDVAAIKALTWKTA